jgi:hypothetical protein
VAGSSADAPTLASVQGGWFDVAPPAPADRGPAASQEASSVFPPDTYPTRLSTLPVADPFDAPPVARPGDYWAEHSARASEGPPPPPPSPVPPTAAFATAAFATAAHPFAGAHDTAQVADVDLRVGSRAGSRDVPQDVPQDGTPTVHRDAYGRLVLVDLSGQNQGVPAPQPAEVRVFGSSTGAEAPSTRWRERTVDLGTTRTSREAPRARSGRLVLVIACIAATLGVGAAVVMATLNQAGEQQVHLGTQNPTTEADTSAEAVVVAPSVAGPSLLPSTSTPAGALVITARTTAARTTRATSRSAATKSTSSATKSPRVSTTAATPHASSPAVTSSPPVTSSSTATSSSTTTTPATTKTTPSSTTATPTAPTPVVTLPTRPTQVPAAQPAASGG